MHDRINEDAPADRDGRNISFKTKWGNPLDGAKYMMALGFSVGPLDGKLPLTKHGVKDFHRDLRVLAAQSRQYPGCNWGCTQDGVLVLDVDWRNGGRVAALGLLPEHATLTIRTGSGGWHFFFRHTGPVRGKVQGIPGIDIKAGGRGYVVAAGSLHPTTGRPYTVHRDGPIAPLPTHLLALIVKPSHVAPSPITTPPSGDRWDGLIRTVDEAIEGGRNAALFWAVARAAADSAPESVYSALAAAAHQIGLGATEIQQTIQSGKRKGAA